MFFKLTFYDGTALRIRPELIQSYGYEQANGANSYVSTANGLYQLKETVGEIDKYFEDILMPDADDPKKGWK